MFQTLKNNTKSAWKTFLPEFRRRYQVIFETRDIERVRDDYFSDRWISKEELDRLLRYEEAQFVQAYGELQANYRDVLSYFNMNSLSNYALLERKNQGKLEK